MHCTKTTARRDEKHLNFGIWCNLYYRFEDTMMGPYCTFCTVASCFCCSRSFSSWKRASNTLPFMSSWNRVKVKFRSHQGQECGYKQYRKNFTKYVVSVMQFLTRQLWYRYSGTPLERPELQNLVHFHAPLFTNYVYLTPHNSPALLKGHHLGWPL